MSVVVVVGVVTLFCSQCVRLCLGDRSGKGGSGEERGVVWEGGSARGLLNVSMCLTL